MALAAIGNPRRSADPALAFWTGVIHAIRRK